MLNINMEEIDKLKFKVVLAQSLKKGFDETYFDFSLRVTDAVKVLATDIQEFVKVLFVAGLEPLESAYCYDNSTADMECLVNILNQQFAIDKPKAKSPSIINKNGNQIIKETARSQISPEEPLSNFKKGKVYTRRHLLEHAFNMGLSPSLNGFPEFKKVCHNWINEKFPVAEEELREKFVDAFVRGVAHKYRKGQSRARLLSTKKYRSFLDGIIQFDNQDSKRRQLVPKLEASFSDPLDPLLTEISTSKTPPTPRREQWSKEYACSQCSFKTKDQEELNFHYNVHDKEQKDSVLVSGNASPKALTGSLEHEQNIIKTDEVKKACDGNFASVQTDSMANPDPENSLLSNKDVVEPHIENGHKDIDFGDYFLNGEKITNKLAKQFAINQSTAVGRSPQFKENVITLKCYHYKQKFRNECQPDCPTDCKLHTKPAKGFLFPFNLGNVIKTEEDKEVCDENLASDQTDSIVGPETSLITNEDLFEPQGDTEDLSSGENKLVENGKNNESSKVLSEQEKPHIKVAETDARKRRRKQQIQQRYSEDGDREDFQSGENKLGENGKNNESSNVLSEKEKPLIEVAETDTRKRRRKQRIQQRYPEDVPYVLCQHCGKSIRNIMTNIREHYASHLEGKEEFQCSDCGKFYATEYKLKHHRHVHHTFLTCDQCGAVVRRGFLSEHIHNHHTPEEKKKYRCECQPDCPKDCKLHCNPPKGFFYQNKLQDHLNMHRGIKPYNCNMGCSNAAFANSANLSAHIRSFHKGIKRKKK